MLTGGLFILPSSYTIPPGLCQHPEQPSLPHHSSHCHFLKYLYYLLCQPKTVFLTKNLIGTLKDWKLCFRFKANEFQSPSFHLSQLVCTITLYCVFQVIPLRYHLGRWREAHTPSQFIPACCINQWSNSIKRFSIITCSIFRLPTGSVLYSSA